MQTPLNEDIYIYIYIPNSLGYLMNPINAVPPRLNEKKWVIDFELS